METILDGIVLSSLEYRENDAILTFLGRDDCKYRVVARGVQKIGSKNAGALLPGTQSSFTLELKENRTLHAMKQARISVYRRHIGESLLKQALSSFYCEAMNRVENFADSFALLEQALDDLEHHDDCFVSACVFVNQLCLQQGIAPCVDNCVSCGRKDHIAALSLRQGGFLCSSCANHMQEIKCSKEQLRKFRYLCHADMKHLKQLRSCYHYDWNDFQLIYAFFKEYSGIHANSFQFLEQVSKMELM